MSTERIEAKQKKFFSNGFTKRKTAKIIAIFTVSFSHVHYNVVQRVREAILV